MNYLSARLTTQVTQKNKFTLYYDRAYKNKNHDMTDSIQAGGGTAGGGFGVEQVFERGGAADVDFVSRARGSGRRHEFSAELADDLLKDFAILAGLGDGIGIENDAAGLDLGAVTAHAVLAHHGGSGLLIVLRGGLGLGSNGPDSEEDRRSCKEE